MRTPPQIFVSDCDQPEAMSPDRSPSVLDGFAEGECAVRTVHMLCVRGTCVLAVVLDVVGIPARVLVDGVPRTGRRVGRWRLEHVPSQSRPPAVCGTLK